MTFVSETLNHTINQASYIQHTSLFIDKDLYTFINDEVLPDIAIDKNQFWSGFDAIVQIYAPKNKILLQERHRLQHEIDVWHQNNTGSLNTVEKQSAYRELLNRIGYLVPEPEHVQITTSHVDEELAVQAGPQLVVPILNARYALNAANARWGSLYNALYGTDVLSEEDGATQQGEKGNAYNPIRGQKVVDYAKQFLNEIIPLKQGTHQDVQAYNIAQEQLQVYLKNGTVTTLLNPEQCIAYQGDKQSPSHVLFKHHRLHIDIIINRDTAIGSLDTAGISDIILESALSTILDLEDSVAVVDAQDKLLAYRHWLGILKGTLTETVHKAGKTFTRGLNQDRHYQTLNGTALTLHGRSLMFVRNVGHLMTNPAILYVNPHDKTPQEIPEGVMDAIITTLIGLYDLKANQANASIKNSRQGSIYIVKPKMHGPDEVAFANDLFTSVEQLLNLPNGTVKLGIMDEERRTSVNLKACIAAAAHRVAFINTGFLDRTGDEMHTAMYAGAMLRKSDMKHSVWLQTYERNNVNVGLSCGLKGKAQIGKGMWAMPDLMAEMMKQKVSHPKSGANTAWVPSPTAATLHALHYHQIDVSTVQEQLIHTLNTMNRNEVLKGLLTLPIVDKEAINWSSQERQSELDNNVQGILGYVVRWINQGIGCSKVPDIHGIGLMEDRATLRISSQHIANWLHHGVLTQTQVLESFSKMAQVVDLQNAGDTDYISLKGNEDKPAYQAALDLVFKGIEQPNGYTEPLLHAWRLNVKSSY